MSAHETSFYSKGIKGDEGNYEWEVNFDLTRGYVGISQMANGTHERVLLSPAQTKELVAFIEKYSPKRRILHKAKKKSSRK